MRIRPSFLMLVQWDTSQALAAHCSVEQIRNREQVATGFKQRQVQRPICDDSRAEYLV